MLNTQHAGRQQVMAVCGPVGCLCQAGCMCAEMPCKLAPNSMPPLQPSSDYACSVLRADLLRGDCLLSC
jgi:hypothetical protein